MSIWNDIAHGALWFKLLWLGTIMALDLFAMGILIYSLIVDRPKK